MSGFVHLQVRSAWSLHRGPRTPADLVREAARRGHAALALTDLNGIHGLPAFQEACRDEGITPLFGMELRDDMGGGAVLIARTARGFSSLCRLATLRAAGPLPDLAGLVPEHQEGLAVLTDRPGLLQAWKGSVEDLFALVHPWSRAVVPPALALGIPLAAAWDATYLEARDRETERVLIAIGGNRPLAGVEDRELSHPRAFLASPQEAQDAFHDIPEALEGTRSLAARVEFHELFQGFLFPRWSSPSGRPALQELRDRVLRGAMDRYGEIGEGVLERIDYELEIIACKGFGTYFLTVADIVALSPRTCGRGSGAASIVSYCLGITNVDPVRHRLYFERFLNRERQDPPDIDIDFAWDERDEVIRRVMEQAGPGHAARVANHLHFQGRSAIRELGRIHGLPEGEIGSWQNEAWRPGGTVRREGIWQEILDMAARIEGLPRGLAVHCGGVVMSPGPMDAHTSLHRAPAGIITAWEKDGVEAAGLVKIDLLGNRSLAVIRDALANLAEQGIHVDPFTWNPQDDPDTVALLARGDSLGVFYVESPAMRQLQVKTGRGDFDHLVIHSSIIRPAANRFIDAYIRRLKGESWVSLDSRLDDILAETYGILCYQEDISKVAMALAGFSEGEADQLRKVVSKKAGKRLLVFRDRFFEGCRQGGLAEESIQAIWDMILSFDGYSFCKPHSASYAMVSFQSAWIKAHHPAEFLAAVLSNEGGFYTPSAYVSEARRQGIGIDGPDVNRSRRTWHAEGGRLRVGLMALAGLSADLTARLLQDRARNGPFRDPEDLVRRTRPGRDDLSSLARSGALDCLSPGQDRSTLLRRCILASRLSGTSPPARRRGSGASEWIQGDLLAGEDSPSGPGSDPAGPQPFPGSDGPPARALTAPPGPAPASLAALRDEEAVLGFLVHHHPLVLWQQRLERRTRIRACDMALHTGRTVRLIGWPVCRKEVLSRTGEAMEFHSFEDETALYETVLFPDAYRRHAALLWNRRPFWLTGTVDQDHGALCLNVRQVEE